MLEARPLREPRRRRPLLVILCVLTVLVWGRWHLALIDPRLSRCASVSGVQALLWYLSGDFAKAARHYRAHYEVTGEPTSRSVPADYAALVMGDLRLAEAAANQALQADPNATGPRLTLAELALRRGDEGQALQWCDEVLQRETDQFDALLLVSIAQARLGRDGEAIHSLNWALRHDRVEERTSSLLMALEVTGELARRPRAQRPWCLLAHYYRYLRIVDSTNGHRAIACAKRAIALGDHRADAWLVLGIVYDKQERRHKALEALLKAVELDPTHAEALRWTSRIYGKFGDVLRESEMARRAWEAAPDDDFYLGHYSYVLTEKLGDYRQALEGALQGLARNAHDASAVWRVAWAYQVLGEQDKALVFYQETIQVDPDIISNNLTPWLGYGDSLRALGRIEEAFAAYREAASRQPWSFQPILELAQLYHETRRYPEAIQAYEQALTLGDNDVQDLSNLCALYHVTSQFQRAADCFREVLRRDPQESRAQRLLPEVLNNLQGQSATP